MELTQIHLHTLLALLVSWVLGVQLVGMILGTQARQDWALKLGYGYLLGLMATTLLLRLSSKIGLSFDYTILLVMHFLLIAAIGYSRRHMWHGTALPTFSRPKSVLGYELIGIALLLMLLGARYSLLLEEVLLRPVFAWDAWMNWSPRAIVWFEQGYIAPFVDRGAWLNQSAQQEVYVLANPWTGWDYPATIPLIQVWAMLASGTTGVNPGLLAWWFVPIAVAFCFYGHLRLWGVKPLPTLVLIYLFMSLPYLNIHTALAGYADIWLAAAFVMMALSMQEWRNTSDHRYLILSLVFALICTQLKNPGLILGAIFLPVYFFAEPRIDAKWKLIALCLAVMGTLCALTVGITLEIPGIGAIILNRDVVQLPVVGLMKIEFSNVSGAITDSLFRMSNWHMLFYLLAVSIAVGLFRPGRATRFSSPLFLYLLAGSAFIFAVFFFTRHSAHAEDFRTLNRAILYLVPLATITIISLNMFTDASLNDSTPTKRQPDRAGT